MSNEVSNLDVLRMKRMRVVDAKTRSLIEGGFVFKSQRLSSSPTAQANWLGAYVSRADLTYPLTVASFDDTAFVTIDDAAAVAAAYTALRQHVTNLVVAGAVIKKAIKDASTEEAVAAVEDNRSL